MRERTQIKAKIAAALTLGGESKESIGTLLGVSPRRVVRMINTPDGKQAMKQIMDQVTEGIIEQRTYMIINQISPVITKEAIPSPIEIVKQTVAGIIENGCQKVPKDEA